MIMHIIINTRSQQLHLMAGEQVLHTYPVSTGLNGVGQQKGSGCTPLGTHIIRAKIGGALPPLAVLKGRRWTGEICTPALYAQHPNRDWILSRILWLSGCERGHNRLGEVDTMQRYIYLHGTPDEHLLGTPVSHGCIRMSNADVIELYERVAVGTPVAIV